jgi:hypothetical protein
MAALVEFVCARADHRGLRVSSSSTITMRERRWAFCPSDEASHEWVAIEPTPIEEVISKALRPVPLAS